MKLFKVLFALIFLATGIAIEALKLVAGSPEAICVSKGFEFRTEEFNQCVREQQQQAAEEQRPDTGVVPYQPHEFKDDSLNQPYEFRDDSLDLILEHQEQRDVRPE